MSTRTAPAPAQAAHPRPRRPPAGLAGGLVLAAVVVALLAPFLGADPPGSLTGSNAPNTDEGFNLANARHRVLFGEFATGEVDRSLTNGAYSAVAAAVFALTEPTLAAGRAVSVAALALAVLLLAAGLAEALGTAAAWLAAAALAGANLALEYGRLGLVEPTVVAWLTGGLVLAVRAARSGSPLAGTGAGLALAAAISVKATAVVPAAAVLAVPLVSAVAGRDRRRLAAALAAPAALAAAALAWLALVAWPNWERLRVALAIWPDVSYPRTPAGLAARLGDYLAGSDQALGRSAPLLAAAAAGLVLAAWRWRSLDRAARDTLVMAALWGFGLWLAIAAGDYGPNRYVVPALPGLAVLAGFGLAGLAGRLPRGGAALAVALGLLVAAPGAARYLAEAAGGDHRRERDQAVLAAALPPGAVVYGTYAPTLLFDTRAELHTLWPPAGANVDDPAGRLGVSHVLAVPAADDPTDPTLWVPQLRRLAGAAGVAEVGWADRTLRLYQLAPDPGGTR